MKDLRGAYRGLANRALKYTLFHHEKPSQKATDEKAHAKDNLYAHSSDFGETKKPIYILGLGIRQLSQT